MVHMNTHKGHVTAKYHIPDNNSTTAIKYSWQLT